MSYMLPQA